MTTYFQKARELGQLILASDEAKALAEAHEKQENIEQANYDYHALVNQVINMIKATVYEDEGLNAGHSCGGGCCGKNV